MGAAIQVSNGEWAYFPKKNPPFENSRSATAGFGLSHKPSWKTLLPLLFLSCRDGILPTLLPLALAEDPVSVSPSNSHAAVKKHGIEHISPMHARALDTVTLCVCLFVEVFV
jgi:hypothetical protein